MGDTSLVTGSPSRTQEFASGATSHAYRPSLVPYANKSVLQPNRASPNGLAPESYESKIWGLPISPNGQSSASYQQSIQLKLPYLHTFGGQFHG